MNSSHHGNDVLTKFVLNILSGKIFRAFWKVFFSRGFDFFYYCSQWGFPYEMWNHLPISSDLKKWKTIISRYQIIFLKNYFQGFSKMLILKVWKKIHKRNKRYWNFTNFVLNKFQWIFKDFSSNPRISHQFRPTSDHCIFTGGARPNNILYLLMFVG